MRNTDTSLLLLVCYCFSFSLKAWSVFSSSLWFIGSICESDKHTPIKAQAAFSSFLLSAIKTLLHCADNHSSRSAVAATSCLPRYNNYNEYRCVWLIWSKYDMLYTSKDANSSLIILTRALFLGL